VEGGDLVPTLRANGARDSTGKQGNRTDKQPTVFVPFAKKHGANHADDHETWDEAEVARSLNSMGQAGTNGALAAAATAGAVRRLSPTECERLQGFPDGWTVIPPRRQR
jgi:site-specific DNA-cytosine methylase